jgi:hypothetical protein
VEAVIDGFTAARVIASEAEYDWKKNDPLLSPKGEFSPSTASASRKVFAGYLTKVPA